MLALLASGALAAAPASAAIGLSQAREFEPRELIVKFEGEPAGRTIRLPEGLGVRRAARLLRRNPRLAYAAPNYIARASAPGFTVPNDRGTVAGPPGPPGGWASRQWNFLPWEAGKYAQLPSSPGGIDVVGAWRNLIRTGREGGQGVTVAVLDTGIAYRAFGRRFRRNPDFGPRQFVRGYDFVDNDRVPLDENGHGTHVAGTIAEKTNNRIGLTGIAYRARLMPVRVLDEYGSGAADDIARGIRFAVRRGADVINMSFNFGCGKRVPAIDEELRRAYRRGVITVASIGNRGAEGCVSPPATGPRVIGVGGTTQGGCLGSYSLSGRQVDIVAPGGGTPVADCPSALSAPIYQITFKRGTRRHFGHPGDYVGTSMAAAHVSGVAALVLASRKVVTRKRRNASLVRALTARLARTARDLGLPRSQQGAGLLDAARATDPSL